MKYRFLLIINFCCMLLFVACSPKNTSEIQPQKKRVSIGFSIDSFLEERRVRDRDVFVEMAGNLGADVNIQIADDNGAQQESQLLFLLESGVDVLLVIPCSDTKFDNVMYEAAKRDVPVLSYERLMQNSNVTLFLGFNAEKVGMLQAEACMASNKKRKIVVYNYPMTDSSSKLQHDGIIKVLSPHIESGQAEIVVDYEAQTRSTEEAYNFIVDLVSKNVKFNAVLAADDMAAEAIIKALSLTRRLSSVFVAGSDADLSACQRIAEGSQSMTVYKTVDQMAAKAAELAVYLALRDKFTIHNSMFDGTYRVPFYELTPIPIAAKNLNTTVIKDGFHLAEDVYRNVIK